MAKQTKKQLAEENDPREVRRIIAERNRMTVNFANIMASFAVDYPKVTEAVLGPMCARSYRKARTQKRRSAGH